MFVAISSDLSLPAHHSANESGNMKNKIGYFHKFAPWEARNKAAGIEY